MMAGHHAPETGFPQVALTGEFSSSAGKPFRAKSANIQTADERESSFSQALTLLNWQKDSPATFEWQLWTYSLLILWGGSHEDRLFQTQGAQWLYFQIHQHVWQRPPFPRAALANAWAWEGQARDDSDGQLWLPSGFAETVLASDCSGRRFLPTVPSSPTASDGSASLLQLPPHCPPANLLYF